MNGPCGVAGLDGPFGFKQHLRFMLTMRGINLNDLEPGCRRPDDLSFKSLAEMWMCERGISVEDLKEGSIYQLLDRGKGIHGEDIDDAREYMDKILKTLTEKKAKDVDPTLLDQWNALPDEYRRSVLQSPVFSKPALEYYSRLPNDSYKFQRMMELRRLIKPPRTGYQEEIFDSIGRPFPVRLKDDPQPSTTTRNPEEEEIFDSIGRPFPVRLKDDPQPSTTTRNPEEENQKHKKPKIAALSSSSNK